MVDFGALPPEINSARMYAGPGSASLVAAAQMWDSVASDLFSAASAFQSVVWGLTVGSWIGSSAGLMVAAASPYVAWMSVTAGQAELTAAPDTQPKTSSPPASPEATVPDHHPVKAALQEIQATKVCSLGAAPRRSTGPVPAYSLRL